MDDTADCKKKLFEKIIRFFRFSFIPSCFLPFLTNLEDELSAVRNMDLFVMTLKERGYSGVLDRNLKMRTNRQGGDKSSRNKV